MAKKGLGKGLNALFTENTVEIDLPEKGVTILKLTQVEPKEKQPRKSFDENALRELSQSILEHGIIQPILVRPTPEGYYQIIAGERRWRAARMAGLSEVPVIIKEYGDREAAEIALIENLQREDLNALEESQGYKMLMDDFNLSQEEVAARVGKSRPAVANSLRLLSLPETVKEFIKDGSLSAGHARAIITLGDRAVEASQTIKKRGLSVRETESLVKKIIESDKERKKPGNLQVDYMGPLENELSDILGRRVRVIGGRKKGRIEIEFYGLEDLRKLMETLGRPEL